MNRLKKTYSDFFHYVVYRWLSPSSVIQ